MKHPLHPLVPLVQTLDDGIEFYRIAENTTDSLELKFTFKKMVDIREFALAYLLPYIGQHDLAQDKSFAYHGTLANRYAALLTDVVTDHHLELVREIEEHLIDAMLDAAATSHNALVQCIIKDLIPRIASNFDECLQTQAAIAA